MTVLIAQFRPRVAARIHGVADPLIDQAVVDTLVDFCERSLVWKVTLDPMRTAIGVKEYDLDPPKDTKVVKIMRSWLDSSELTPVGEEAVASPFGFVKTITGLDNPTGRPQTFLQPEPGLIGVQPVPDAVYTLTLRVALAPTRSTDCVDDFLFEDWVDVITNGSLARLYGMPEFLNPVLAGSHMALFERGLNAASIQATRGRTVAEMRVVPRRI